MSIGLGAATAVVKAAARYSAELELRSIKGTGMANHRVLVVGLGSMGISHALAYTRIVGFEVVGLCQRRIAERKLPPVFAKAARFARYEDALAELKPDVVSINTFTDTH